MRIGADASHLRWSRVGIGAYLDGMLHGLEAGLAGDDEMTVFYNARPGPRLFGPRVRERHLRAPGSLAWNQVAVPLGLVRDRCDVYLGGANLIPAATGVPRVVVIHDCKPFRVPEADSRSWVRYMRRWMRVSTHRAARVVAVSRWAAAECTTFLGVPAEQITVIYQGVDATFRPAVAGELETDASTVDRLGVQSPYVLQVGGFEKYKGGEIAAAAVTRLRAAGRPLTLVRCGQKGQTSAVPGTVDLGYVGTTELLALYRAASVVCVPSRHEGFGRPVIEAMACGTPVVASDAGGLPEAGGDAASYVAVGDVDGLTTAIAGLLDEDTGGTERRRQAGFRQAARFRWDQAAREMRDVLAQAAGSRGG